MKKQLFLVAVLALAAFSCQKEEVRPTNLAMTKRTTSPMIGQWSHVTTKEGPNDPWVFETNPELFTITETRFVTYGYYTYTPTQYTLNDTIGGNVVTVLYSIIGNVMTWTWPNGGKWKLSRT